MNSVNFLPVMRVSLALRIPGPLQNACIALATSLAVVITLTLVDHHRLVAVQAREHAAAATYRRAQESAVRAQRLYRSARAAVELDRRVVAIAQSGSSEAALFANFASALPASMWVESMQRERGAVLLSGEVRDLPSLARSMRTIAALRAIKKVMLVRVSTTGRPGALIRYVLRVTRT